MGVCACNHKNKTSSHVHQHCLSLKRVNHRPQTMRAWSVSHHVYNQYTSKRPTPYGVLPQSNRTLPATQSPGTIDAKVPWIITVRLRGSASLEQTTPCWREEAFCMLQCGAAVDEANAAGPWCAHVDDERCLNGQLKRTRWCSLDTVSLAEFWVMSFAWRDFLLLILRVHCPVYHNLSPK